jgi:outer membrane protein OmpA-like peptidoglycan-associated protein
MRVRLLLAAGVLSFVPAFVRAQDVPAAAPVPTAPIVAQRGGSWEFSLGGGLFLVDSTLNRYLSSGASRIVNKDDSLSRLMEVGRLRVTYNFSSHLGLGAGIGIANGLRNVGNDNGALLIAPFLALSYTLDLNRKFSPFIEVGGEHSTFGAYRRFPFSTDRPTKAFKLFAGFGFRAMISNALALRVEGRIVGAKYDTLSNSRVNGSVVLGLSYFLGGRPPRDLDGDGVPDKKDLCADTPLGAIVDTQGCALDSDTDGVYDGLDQCADTPEGATVDAQGCALDTDRDGVYDGLDQCPDTPAGATVDANGCPVDTDGDGVADYLDRCANTPTGVPVDANGCPVDTDNDGVTDNNDRCPNTPANARPVNATGCPVDTDNDGVADYLDRCANTAAGTQVDANGCPVARDADSDGVIDANDRCANTPPNTRVDATGCPLAELPAAGAALVLRNITFRANTAVLLPSSAAELDYIAASLRSVPDARWEIAGHTDNRGTRLRNRELSQQRAEAVMRYLMAKGVPSASLVSVGYGSQNPAVSNLTATGRAQNRRVEIKRLQ